MAANLNEKSPDGILLIDKQEGKSSFDAVRMIRKILNCKKTGHAGTLDPFATGLLVILLGQGTKLSSHIMGGKKKYRAEISLGAETDTCDPTGSVIKEMPVPDFDAEKLEEVLKSFTGVIEQVPPAYSALKINGQRAYKLARKGIEVEMKKREVTVYSIDIVDIAAPLITVDVICSAGTYIRSLAVDIGRKLNTAAHLKNLRRLSSGLFSVEKALKQKDLEENGAETLLKSILPLSEALPEMKKIILDDGLAGRVKNGYRPSWDELIREKEMPDIFHGHVKMIHNSNLVAIAEIEKTESMEHNWLKKVKVFN